MSELRLHFTNHHSLTIHQNNHQQINQLTSFRHKEKVDEFLETVAVLLAAPQVMPSAEFERPLVKLLQSEELAKNLKLRQYLKLEPLPYNPSLGYGGVFMAFEESGSAVYVAGIAKKMLQLCKSVYDCEEYERLEGKWRKAGYHTMLIATRDDPDNHRNFLIRGLKNSLNVIALVGVRSGPVVSKA